MRGAAGCAGAPPAAAVSAATTTTATSTAGAAYRRCCRRRRRCLAGAAAAGSTGSQRCPPRGSRHFLPDGSGVQARWAYDLGPQPVAAASFQERED